MLPEVLERVLDAQTAFDVCDRRAHPRISNRLWDALRATRAVLRAEYPQVEEWLFGYPYGHASERLAELRRIAGEGRFGDVNQSPGR